MVDAHSLTKENYIWGKDGRFVDAQWLYCRNAYVPHHTSRA